MQRKVQLSIPRLSYRLAEAWQSHLQLKSCDAVLDFVAYEFNMV